MDSTCDSMTQKGSHSASRRPSGESLVQNVFGFPVDQNQFSVLQSNQSAESQRSTQRETGLVDPRTTRHLRWAAQQTDDQGTKTVEEMTTTVPTCSAAQGIVYSDCVEPNAVRNCSQFFPYSFPACSPDILSLQSGGNVQYMLDSGAAVNVGDDYLYDSLKCNKRISCAGPEWSAGRPGHTPTRRTFACEKLIEDSCAGQDWSAGRPGLTPFGASSAACPSSHTACIGPYGTAVTQPHYTGCNPREETSTASSASGLPRHEDQSTIQHRATSSRRHAANDRASPVTVVLQPRRPPYFCGGIDDDVHVWTAIVDHWLSAIQGEPSVQLTFIVSLLRGAAYEWYLHYETHTGCPGDWTTLRHAMLERFGTSIRAEKARAGLY